MNYTYKFPRPAVTVDIIVCAVFENDVKILLIKRLHPPYENCWAFPGGFVDENEDLLEAAHRELNEEVGVKGLKLKQLKAFGKYGRDPRGHTISIVFGAVVDNMMPVQAGDDAGSAEWFSLNNLPPLAFDHEEIVATVMPSLIAKK